MALVHSFEYTVNINHKKQITSGVSFIKCKICNFRTMEDTYQLIKVNSIVASSISIVDKSKEGYDTNICGIAEAIIIVGKVDKWHFHFTNQNDKELAKQAETNKDDDYPMGSKRHFLKVNNKVHSHSDKKSRTDDIKKNKDLFV